MGCGSQDPLSETVALYKYAKGNGLVTEHLFCMETGPRLDPNIFSKKG